MLWIASVFSLIYLSSIALDLIRLVAVHPHGASMLAIGDRGTELLKRILQLGAAQVLKELC